MIPLTNKLYLSDKDNLSSIKDSHGYIYYKSGTLVSNSREYEKAFKIAAAKGLIISASGWDGDTKFYRDNRLTELGKALMKLMG